MCTINVNQLSMTIVVFNLFYQRVDSRLFKQMLHSEVVSRGSETQLQVGENLNQLS